MHHDLSALREQYRGAGLTRADLAADPIEQFAGWFREWAGTETSDPNAVVLATADSTGAPSARMVLLKAFGAEGFTFYGNAESRKGTDLEANPQAALLFAWYLVGRQVRVRGRVVRETDAVVDTYFTTRPRPSQVAAWASAQSRPVADRAALEAKVAEAAAQAEQHGGPVPRPPAWVGWRLVPDEVEFWVGRADRLHDRFQYRREAGLSNESGWVIERLQP